MTRVSSRVAAMAACCLLTLACGTVEAAVVAKAVGPSVTNDLNLNSFTVSGVATQTAPVSASGNWMEFTEAGRYFGLSARVGGVDNTSEVTVVDPDPSFSSLDDTLNGFPNDSVGIVGSTDFDNFFGMSDTVNANNSNLNNAADTFYTAVWNFNISSAVGGLTINFDVAAAGDFEAPNTSGGDSYILSYSLDGGATYTNFVTSNIKDTSFTTAQLADPGTITDPDVLYTMESGAVVALNDPLTLNGVVIKNVFQTFSTPIGSTASTSLLVRFVGTSDGTAEAILIRNLTIEDGGTTPGLIGDYNGDGSVDAADYTVWRDGGSPDSSPTGYTAWAGNYGATAPPSVSIPEPTAALLAMIALAGLASRRV